MIVEIKDDYVNMRVDRFLKKYSNFTKNSDIFKYIKNGKIKINKKKTKENYRLQKEDLLEILDDNINLDRNYINDIDIDDFDYGEVIFSDDNLFIVNKKPFISMHKGTNIEYGLSEYFKMKYNNKDINFSNRLDYKTSGLVIGCKNQKTLRYINSLISSRKIVKKYIAKIYCNNKNKFLDYKDFKKVTLVEDNKEYVSYFKLINVENNIYTFEIKLETGRKHQIRKQFKNLGYPIIGDDKYGNYSKTDNLELKCFYINFEINQKKYEFVI